MKNNTINGKTTLSMKTKNILIILHPNIINNKSSYEKENHHHMKNKSSSYEKQIIII
jgi:hypothetical protein